MKHTPFMAAEIEFAPEFEFGLTLLGDPAMADEILRPLLWQIATDRTVEKFPVICLPDLRLAVFDLPRHLTVQRIAIFFRNVSKDLIELKRLCVEMREHTFGPLDTVAFQKAA